MELLDSRCRVCKDKDWQCGVCQKKDKKQRQTKRKQRPATAEPTIEPNTKPTLRSFLKDKGFVAVRIPRDGHCLFAAVASAFKTFRPDLPHTYKELREACAKKLALSKVRVPGMVYSEDGETVELRRERGEKAEWVCLDKYCDLLRTKLYGGFEEMKLMANLFSLRFNVYVDSCFDGHELNPSKILQDDAYDEEDPVNAGVCICYQSVSFLLIVSFHSGTTIDLLFETGGSGTTDHWTLLLPKNAQWNYLMKSMPTIDVDYCVADFGAKLGRGLKTLRTFHKGDVIGCSPCCIL
jgi:hypothetical protein